MVETDLGRGGWVRGGGGGQEKGRERGEMGRREGAEDTRTAHTPLAVSHDLLLVCLCLLTDGENNREHPISKLNFLNLIS